MGPPVPRSAANPWVLGLENCIGSSTSRAEPIAARVWPKLVNSKSPSECCEGPGPNEKKYVKSFLD